MYNNDNIIVYFILCSELPKIIIFFYIYEHEIFRNFTWNKKAWDILSCMILVIETIMDRL